MLLFSVLSDLGVEILSLFLWKYFTAHRQSVMNNRIDFEEVWKKVWSESSILLMLFTRV